VRSTSRIDEIDEWMIAGLQREFSAAQNIAQKSVGTVFESDQDKHQDALNSFAGILDHFEAF